MRVFLSFFPTEGSRKEPVTSRVHAHRNRLAHAVQALQPQPPAPPAPAPAPATAASESAPFLFLYVHNLVHPLTKLRADDVVLYVPTARYRALVVQAEGGYPANEEVEAVRLKALSSPATVIAITSHPSAMDGVDSPDHIPPQWRSAHFALHRDEDYAQLLSHLQRIRADPTSASARAYQQPPVASSALLATSQLPPHSQELSAQPDARVKRMLASAGGRLRLFISFSAHDPELSAFHPQAVRLLADALNAHLAVRLRAPLAGRHRQRRVVAVDGGGGQARPLHPLHTHRPLPAAGNSSSSSSYRAGGGWCDGGDAAHRSARPRG